MSEDPYEPTNNQLLTADAVMGVYNALVGGWSETEEFTVQATREQNVLLIDLPATRQQVRVTVEITRGV